MSIMILILTNGYDMWSHVLLGWEDVDEVE